MGEPVLEALIDIHDKLTTDLVNYADKLVQKLKENKLLSKYQTTLLHKEKHPIQKIQYILKYCVQFRLRAGIDGPFQVLMELMRSYSSDDKNLVCFVEYFEKLQVAVVPVQQVTDDFSSIQQTANNFQQNLGDVKLNQMANDSRSTAAYFIVNQPVTEVSISEEEKQISQHNVNHSNHPVAEKINANVFLQRAGDLSSVQLTADPSSASQHLLKDSNLFEEVAGNSNPNPNQHVTEHFSQHQQTKKDSTTNLISSQQTINHFSPSSQFSGNSNDIHQVTGDLNTSAYYYNSSQQFTDSHPIQPATSDLSDETCIDYDPSQHVAADSNPVQQETGNMTPNQHSSDPRPLVFKTTSAIIQQVTDNFGAHQHTASNYNPSQKNIEDSNPSDQVTEMLSACEHNTGHSNVNQDITENTNPIQQVTDNSSAHQHVTNHFNPSQQVIDDSNPSEQAGENLSTNQSIVNQCSPNQNAEENTNPIQQVMGDFSPGLRTPDHKNHPDSVSAHQQDTTNLSVGQQVMSPNQESVFDEANYNTNYTNGKCSK